MGSRKVFTSGAPKWVVGLASASFGGLVFLLGMYGFYALSYRGQIFPNTLVASLEVGGLTPQAAESLVTEHVRTFEHRPIPFTIDGTALNLDPTNLKVSYDAAASAARAYQLGRSGTIWNNASAQVSAVFQSNDLPLVYSYQPEALTGYLDGLSTRFDSPQQDAGVQWRRNQLVVTPEVSGQRFDRVALEAMITASIASATVPVVGQDFPLRRVEPAVTRSHAQQLLPTITSITSQTVTLQFETESFVITPEQLVEWTKISRSPGSTGSQVEGFLDTATSATVQFDQDKIGAYVKTLAGEIAQDPVDAKLTIKHGKATVFQAAQEGRTLDEVQTLSTIVKELNDRRAAARSGQAIVAATVQLPVRVTQPTVTSSTVEDLGIQELIGTATTDFSGSPDNRIHNIGNGVKYLNGWLIKPGDEFSTVKALGAIDGSTGYLPELVIKENRTIPEYGGGLCQVSTTLFRSVMNAGLPITERSQHSYRVIYYERGTGPGLDATIYLPRPDLKFKNDTPGWILIQGSVSGLKLTFELYGTSDGRETTIDGPHTLGTTPAPPSVYEQTDQLAPGEQKQLEKAHDGATTVATYTVTRGEEVINQQVFRSKYKALPARYLEGPKVEAQAEPQPAEGEVAGIQDPASPAEQPAQ